MCVHDCEHPFSGCDKSFKCKDGFKWVANFSQKCLTPNCCEGKPFYARFSICKTCDEIGIGGGDWNVYPLGCSDPVTINAGKPGPGITIIVDRSDDYNNPTYTFIPTPTGPKPKPYPVNPQDCYVGNSYGGPQYIYPNCLHCNRRGDPTIVA